MSERNNDEPGTGKRTFKVTDKRIFSEGADSNDGADGDAREAQQASPSASPSRDKTEGARAPALPPVDFQTFVISLGSSALMHLGALEHPETGRSEVNLDLAKHTIDVLSMLEKKTQGNLSASETNLLTGLLYDLRLKYVEAARK